MKNLKISLFALLAVYAGVSTGASPKGFDPSYKPNAFSTRTLAQVKEIFDYVANALVTYQVGRNLMKERQDFNEQVETIKRLLVAGEGTKWMHKRTENNIREVNEAISKLRKMSQDIVKNVNLLRDKGSVSEQRANRNQLFQEEQERDTIISRLITDAQERINNPAEFTQSEADLLSSQADLLSSHASFGFSKPSSIELHNLAYNVRKRVHEYRMANDPVYAARHNAQEAAAYHETHGFM